MSCRTPTHAVPSVRPTADQRGWGRTPGGRPVESLLPRTRTGATLGREVVGYGKVLRDRTDVRAQVEALAQANRRKDLFLGTVAHELRGRLDALEAIAMKTAWDE